MPPTPRLLMEISGPVRVIRFADRAIPHDDAVVRQIRDGLYGLLELGVLFLVIDFDGLESFPTLLVGPLLALNGRLKNTGGRLALCCGLDTFARQCFEVMGLLKVLEVYPTQREALRALDP